MTSPRSLHRDELTPDRAADRSRHRDVASLEQSRRQQSLAQRELDHVCHELRNVPVPDGLRYQSHRASPASSACAGVASSLGGDALHCGRDRDGQRNHPNRTMLRARDRGFLRFRGITIPNERGGPVSTGAYKLEAGARDDASYDSVEGTGWLAFAAIMLGFAGTFNFIDGILAIANSKVYTVNATYVFSDLRTWGWIVMLLGIAEVCAAVAIFSGSQFARWFGILAASVNGLGQLMFVHAYPFWSLAIFSVDILIVYALAVHGGSKARLRA
jgi:hypothetical protein